MVPYAVRACNDSLCTQNGAILLAGQLGERVLKLFLCELLGGFNAEVAEYLIGVMTVMVMMVMSAAALAIVMMVLMLIFIMVVVAALMIVVIIVVMVVMMLVLVVIIVVMSAYRADPLVLEEFLGEAVLDLHCLEYLLAVDVIPRSCNDGSMLVQLADHRKSLCKLILAEFLGTAEDYRLGGFHLVLVELAEVLHIHLDLGSVNDSGVGVEHQIVTLDVHDCLQHVGELTNAGRLDEYSVRVKLLQHLRQSLAEISDQGAAYAALVHLCYLDSGVLHESAVNAYLAELVLDEHKLFACVCFLEKLLYKSGLTCSEESGEHIYLCHNTVPLSEKSAVELPTAPNI